MRNQLFDSVPLNDQEMPTCPRCNLQMRPVRTIAMLPDFEVRTFRCSRCTGYQNFASATGNAQAATLTT
jgi:hypothetical protein